MKKTINQITKVVHVAYGGTNMPHCGSYVVLANEVSMDTEVTCGHCKRIFRHDPRVVPGGPKIRAFLIKELKNLLEKYPRTNTFTMRMEPDTLKALIHFMENYSSATSMSEAINEIVPKYVRKLNLPAPSTR